ncbi:site-2 protease family protein [Candidatus Saccharibacteria bacterium]|nr:site-2 protease family protein [Candidatus Saccharibacteria bacterium]
MGLNVVAIVVYLGIVIIALTVHEFCHAWAGHMLGDVTAKHEGRLTLNPLAHIDPFSTLLLPVALILIGSPVVFGAAKPVPFNPYAVRYGKWGAALVAVAGPFSNLFMAIVVGTYLRFIPLSGLSAQILLQFVLINLAFFVFNMIPIPPLDGSRVLYAAVPPSVQDIMDQIERYGIIVIFAFLFIAYRFLSPFILSAVTGLAGLILGHPIMLQ